MTTDTTANVDAAADDDKGGAATPTAGAGRGSAAARLAIFIVVVVAVLTLLVRQSGRIADALEIIRSVVDRAGLFGPVLFVLAYAVLTVLLVPGSPLTIAAGALFGPFLGTALVVVGATMGAVGSFLWGRRLGRDAVERLAGDRFAKVDVWLGERGMVAVLYLRLVGAPFNISNPIAGVTGIKLRDFTVGTFVGIIPGSFAFAALGGSLDDPTSPVFLSAIALTLVLAVGAPIVDRRRRAARVTAAGASD
jgi:uncharacterized membrane protein YdjX (TVP38/TMEM64 family)